MLRGLNSAMKGLTHDVTVVSGVKIYEERLVYINSIPQDSYNLMLNSVTNSAITLWRNQLHMASI